MTDAIDWVELRNENFYCLPAECWLDPSKPAKRAIISHAHGDHFPRFGGSVWGSPETIEIGIARHGKTAARSLIKIPFETPTQVGDVTVELLQAGHILGSAQLSLKYNGQHVLFSGDFSLMDNPTCPPISYPKTPVDLLICESTFGLKVVHPDPEKELQRELERADGKAMVIGAYALGKGQRLTEMLNRLAPDRTIMVHPAIGLLNRVYEKAGIALGDWQIFRKKEAREAGIKLVQLVTPAGFTGFAGDRSKHKLLATGWDRSHKFPWMNGSLDISDHASASEIMQYILQIRPKEVWFWHGYPEILIEQCIQNGIAAKALEEIR